MKNLKWFVDRIGNYVSTGYNKIYIIDRNKAAELYSMQFRSDMVFLDVPDFEG